MKFHVGFVIGVALGVDIFANRVILAQLATADTHHQGYRPYARTEAETPRQS